MSGSRRTHDGSIAERYVPRIRPTPVRGLWRGVTAALRARETPDAGLAVFEAAIAEAAGMNEAVAFASARGGIATSLRIAGVRAGDVVVIPSYTAPCVPALLRAMGARVRIATVSNETLLVTPESVRAVAHGARAVLPTHTEGATVDVAAVASSVAHEGTIVLEDGAHALGAEHAGAPVGMHSKGVVISFGQGKHLNTLFGGVVLTHDRGFAAALRSERAAYPMATGRRALTSAAVHYTARALTDHRLYPFTMHAAVRGFMAAGIDLPTLVFEDDAPVAHIDGVLRRWPAGFGELASRQLEGFSRQRAHRRDAARAMRAHLAARGVRHQIAADPGDHPLVVTVLHARREAVRKVLLAHGIDTQPTWMRAIRDDDGRTDPVAEHAEREAFYLPLHDGMSRATIARVLDVLDRAIDEVGGP